MQMTNSEICASYRDAKFKKKQVEILAQLNDCGKKEIIKILSDGGFLPQQLPRTRAEKKEPHPGFAPQKPHSPQRGRQETPALAFSGIEAEIVTMALTDLLKTTEEKKAKIEKQIEALNILIDKCFAGTKKKEDQK